MQSEEMKALMELMRTQSDGVGDDGLTIEQRRQAMEDAQAQIPVPADITTTAVDITGIPGRWVCAPDVREDVTLLYFHGGGYVMGSLDTHTELMGRLSRVCRARVLGVDYRLAPEHVFPAAVEDGVAAYLWLIDQGCTPARIILGGDSAGGGLVLATLLSLRDQKQPMPSGAFLFSPWTDLTASGESATSRAEADPMIKLPALLEIAETYYAGADPTDPLVSPVFASLKGLPPLLIQVGDAELLLDDASRLADNARRDGVIARYQVWERAFHVFQAAPHLPEATEALENVQQFVNELIAA